METTPLWTAEDVATAMQCGKRTVWKMRDSGHLPRALRVGGLVRWRRDEILQWIADGCPHVRRTGWTAP